MYSCTNCDYSSTTKLGKCPSCHAFGTFATDQSVIGVSVKKKNKPSRLWQRLQVGPKKSHTTSLPLTDTELKRLMPEGIVDSGVYLLWGEPGIGKSTLLLQIVQQASQSKNENKIHYYTWEETAQEITGRFQRITNGETIWESIQIYHATRLEDILATADSDMPALIVIDSIQTIYSRDQDSWAWSPSQVKLCSERLSERCKSVGVACIIIWHVTKWWEIAWPKYLEHIVDVVLYLEGDRYGQYRFLRCRKNRFGPTDDVAVFEMSSNGLQWVNNFSSRSVHKDSTVYPGTVTSIAIDNGRPVLISVEALLNKTKTKYPQKTVQWIEPRRVNLIIAILERYLKANLGYVDVFVNIPGEMTFRDSWLDLAIAAALRSQLKQQSISPELVFVWELNLWGNVLPSKYHTKRAKEVTSTNLIDYQQLTHISKLPNLL